MSAEMLPSAENHERFNGGTAYEAEDKELVQALEQIWDIAEKHHLKPFPTHFEVVPPKIMSTIGSLALPERFSHWTHGQQYRQIKTMYDWGLSKIYELVINSNPSQAFLLENNPPIENKFVMAHVLGHTDFFKNNHLFASTRRDMPEAAALDAARAHKYEALFGKLAVEKIFDAALAIEEHIDPYVPFRPSREEELTAWQTRLERKSIQTTKATSRFDDLFDFEPPVQGPEQPRPKLHIPPEPDRDILGFIRNHAPYLEDWQRDILEIVRSESVYFWPQRRTKIMNEGWAAYWHKRIMRVMGDEGHISGADSEAWDIVHSSVVSEGRQRLNPYHLGMKIYEYVEDYYNGNLSDNEKVWLTKEGRPIYPKYEGSLADSPAIPALREVMMTNDDQSFIRNHFDKNVADRLNLFIYEEEERHDGSIDLVVKSTGWKDIRDSLVASFDNCGNPLIVVEDGDFNQSKELYLRHQHDGRDLDGNYIERTLPFVYTLWQRPVHLETRVEDQKVVATYNGKDTLVNVFS